MSCRQATTKLPGSSTACLALLRPGGSLEVVNVGDSGLRVIRGGRVVWATRVQEHSWNCPYQLSHPDIFANTDTVADAAVSSVPLQAGDIIVAGTDGLWDNMWEGQMLDIVGGVQRGKGGGAAAANAAAELAQGLADAAAANGANTRYRGPWAVELEQHQKVRMH